MPHRNVHIIGEEILEGVQSLIPWRLKTRHRMLLDHEHWARCHRSCNQEDIVMAQDAERKHPGKPSTDKKYMNQEPQEEQGTEGTHADLKLCER